jgi:glycosyltransferase involved in cell wall biosynthesis
MDSADHTAVALQTLLAPERAQTQPPLYEHGRPTLTTAIATLALGGAERIVLDWAASCAPQYNVQLVVLRGTPLEWPVPQCITVTRLDAGDAFNTMAQLTTIGAEIAANGNPVVLCHLLTAAERGALARGGARPVPVLHNAAAGWIEEAGKLVDAPLVITVSHAARTELRSSGVRTPCAVVHHLPRTPLPRPDARSHWRAQWALPVHARVIGMIGAIKPQKDYPHALRLLAALLARRDAWLVIVGGPVGRDGPLAWSALLTLSQHLGVDSRVRLTGFVNHAADCLPAFDMLLNTSRHEGLSIATLEALAAGLQVVSGAVGGQGEIPAPELALMPTDATDAQWVNTIEHALDRLPDRAISLPAWRGFPAHRVWTLFHLAQDYIAQPGVLFVTANLNAGGAQRSLCNLALVLNGSMRFEIAVCGDSSSDYFHNTLKSAGIIVHRSAATRDCFDHTEAILQRTVVERYATICFWNVDAKVKLLLVKALAHTAARLIDVSPGGYAFEEMQATRDFQQWIAYAENEYYARLDALVLKYRGNAPDAAHGRVKIIPNGTPLPPRRTTDKGAPRIAPAIVVSGRIAPSKFVLEIVASMRLLWRTHPQAELHLLGRAEPRHAAYVRELLAAIGTELGRRIFVHGAVFDAPEQLGDYTAALILGEHQGSPNAVLEALAAGVPVVANDSGGTREMISNECTGLLLRERDPSAIAAALARVIGDPKLAQHLAQAGRRHVEKNFSMLQMAASYRKLFESGWRNR